MSKSKTVRQVFLSLEARQDMHEILTWSAEKFGEAAAAERYYFLMMQAIRDLETDAVRPGSRTRPDLAADARTYHLSLSQSQVKGIRVKAPRHFILYRISSKGVDVVRILHDSRDLARHVSEDYLP